MRAPLFTTNMGDIMNGLFENACNSDNTAIAFIKGCGIGALDALAICSMVIGTFGVIGIFAEWMKGLSEK